MRKSCAGFSAGEEPESVAQWELNGAGAPGNRVGNLGRGGAPKGGRLVDRCGAWIGVVDNAHPVPDTAGNKKPLRWLAPEGQKSWKRLSPSRRAGNRGDDCDDGYDDGCGRGTEASEGSRGTAERHEEPWKKAPVESSVQPEF